MRRQPLLLFAALILVSTVASGAPLHDEPRSFQDHELPPFMVGGFVDDYGIEYSINNLRWTQLPDTRFQIVEINLPGRYLVATDAGDIPTTVNHGNWVRIDWLELDDAGEYPWAFCYAAYEQDSQQEAVAAPDSDRETPRTGCNGFPFSRMKSAGGTDR